MDEGFDTGSIDTVDIGTDLPMNDTLDFDAAPLDDISSEETLSRDDSPEMSELQNEANALEIEALDDGIDLGYNYDEAIQEANTQWEDEDAAYNPPALENICNAFTTGAGTPSDLTQAAAQFGGAVGYVPSGAEDVTARLIQGTANAAFVGSEEFMEAAYDQHNIRPDLPIEGVDFTSGENGEQIPLSPLVQTTAENGESIWIRPELSKALGETEIREIPPLEDFEAIPNELLDEFDIEVFDPLQEINIDYDTAFEGLDEYDFDGKDFGQNTEQINSLLDGFTEDNWSNMELSEQKEQIDGLFDYVGDVLGLENPPNIEYYQGAEGEYGGFNPETNTLRINEYMLYEANEAADTVAHELWHAYQEERARDPQSPKDFLYQYGFDNYIRPEDDFDGYQSQLVEAEARAFADQFKGALARKGA